MYPRLVPGGNGRDLPDPLAIYLAEIESLPALDASREIELVQRLADGVEVEQARRELIESNLRLVVSIAREYLVPSSRLLELIQEGNIGLIRAVETFNPAAGLRFADVADGLIRRAIERAIPGLDGSDPDSP